MTLAIWLQAILDGVVLGATISLGAIGVTLTYAILRFANFAHGEFITWGGYFALSALGAVAGSQDLAALLGGPIEPFSFGFPLIVALLAAIVITAAMALLIDAIYFRRLRKAKIAIASVIGSFGAALVLRNLVVLGHGADPEYLVREIQIAIRFGPGLRITPDQIALVGVTAALVVALHLFLTRTQMGRAMRGVRENPDLAAVSGIDVAAVIRATWVIGASLAAIAGVLIGLTIQLRPAIGFDLLLPLFSAAILGGIGSVYGAVLGGLVIGIAESLAVLLIGPEYRAAIAFGVLFLILLVRPQGILGGRA
jgi:branched-chain amino acid transport system permease protein